SCRPRSCSTRAAPRSSCACCAGAATSRLPASRATPAGSTRKRMHCCGGLPWPGSRPTPPACPPRPRPAATPAGATGAGTARRACTTAATRTRRWRTSRTQSPQAGAPRPGWCSTTPRTAMPPPTRCACRRCSARAGEDREVPEGPSVVLLREEAMRFRHRTVRRVEGDSRQDIQRMVGRRVLDVRSWGKHFLLAFSGFSLRVHLMMFGSYRIDAPKDRPPRLALHFDKGSLYFYACSVRFIEGPLDAAYDWRGDVMSPDWDPALARRKLMSAPEVLACDALLDQDVFAGVGNIIKNEVLFRIRVHPCTRVG